MLTPEDLEQIRLIVREEIQQAKVPQPNKPPFAQEIANGDVTMVTSLDTSAGGDWRTVSYRYVLTEQGKEKAERMIKEWKEDNSSWDDWEHRQRIIEMYKRLQNHGDV